MRRCGCEMMIEWEVKTGQTAESIENTRRDRGQLVRIQKHERLNVEVWMWNDD